MGWDRKRWDGIKWAEMGHDRLGLDGIGWNTMDIIIECDCFDGMEQDRLGWYGIV